MADNKNVLKKDELTKALLALNGKRARNKSEMAPIPRMRPVVLDEIIINLAGIGAIICLIVVLALMWEV